MENESPIKLLPNCLTIRAAREDRNRQRIRIRRDAGFMECPNS
jgi:hypothetical protein